MQWMKDGFALGVDRSLPGHPTYSMQEDNEGTSSEAMAYIGEYLTVSTLHFQNSLCYELRVLRVLLIHTGWP